MDTTKECIESVLTPQMINNAQVNSSGDNKIDLNASNILRVKYEFLNEKRVLSLFRPIKYDELYQKISNSLNNQSGLLLHFKSPNKEIFGQISNQSDLDQIIQCLESNPIYRRLNILVTSTSPLPTDITPSPRRQSNTPRPESPPPGCLHPNDHIHLGQSPTLSNLHLDGEFIPEDDIMSKSLSNDSCYFGSRGGSGRRSRLPNIPLFPELPGKDSDSYPQRIQTNPFSRTDARQSLPRHLIYSGPSSQDVSSGQGSSVNSGHISDYQSPLDKSMALAKIPSLVDYKKGVLLGRGGFGAVYRCLDLKTGCDFAIKEVLLPVGEYCNKDAVNKEAECLENEINIYTRIKYHQRIVQYFGAKRDQGTVIISMEYMPGGSVKDQLKQYGLLPNDIVARYTKQILQGLVFLHHAQIIHRDIKAANIMRDINCNVKLGDFGASRYLKSISVHQSGENGNGGTRVANTFCGTFYWMAPEVIRGEAYTMSADVWSLAATIVEMCSGNPPYHDLEGYAALYKIANTPKVEYTIPPTVCPQLHTLITGMFVTNPLLRPSADALLMSDYVDGISAD